MLPISEALGFGHGTRAPSAGKEASLYARIFFFFFFSKTHNSICLQNFTTNVHSMDFMKRRALQQGDIVKIDIPSFNKISNPLCTELLHSSSNWHSYTQRESPNNHNRPHHNNPIYYHPFPHLIYTTYLHIQLIFLPQELKTKQGIWFRQTQRRWQQY